MTGYSNNSLDEDSSLSAFFSALVLGTYKSDISYITWPAFNNSDKKFPGDSNVHTGLRTSEGGA